MSYTISISANCSLQPVSNNFDQLPSTRTTTHLFQQINFQYHQYHCRLLLRGSFDISVSVNSKSHCKPEVISKERIVGGFNSQICGSDWVPILCEGREIASVTEKGETVGSQWALLPIVQKDEAGRLSLNLQFRLNGAAGGSTEIGLPYNCTKSLAEYLRQESQSSNKDQSAKAFAIEMINEFRDARPTRVIIREILELSAVPDSEIIEFLISEFLNHITKNYNVIALLQGLNLLIRKIIVNSNERFLEVSVKKILKTLFLTINNSGSEKINKETIRALIQIFEIIRFLELRIKREGEVEESIRILNEVKNQDSNDGELLFLVDCALQALTKLGDDSQTMDNFIKGSKVILKSLCKAAFGMYHFNYNLLEEAISNLDNYPQTLPSEGRWFSDFIKARGLLLIDPPADFVGQPREYNLAENQNLTFAVSLSLIELVFDTSRELYSRLRGIEYLYAIHFSRDFWNPTLFLKKRIVRVLQKLDETGEYDIVQKIGQYQLSNEEDGYPLPVEENLLNEPYSDMLFSHTATKLDRSNGFLIAAENQLECRMRLLRQKILQLSSIDEQAAEFCEILPFMPKEFSSAAAAAFVSQDSLIELAKEGLIRFNSWQGRVIQLPVGLENLLELDQKIASLQRILKELGTFLADASINEKSKRAKIIAAISKHSADIFQQTDIPNTNYVTHFLKAAEHLVAYTTCYSEARDICDLIENKYSESLPYHFSAIRILGMIHRIEGRLDEGHDTMNAVFEASRGNGHQSECYFQFCLEFLRLLIERKDFENKMQKVIEAVDGQLDDKPELKVQLLALQAEIFIEQNYLPKASIFLNNAERIGVENGLNKAIRSILNGKIAFKGDNFLGASRAYQEAQIILRDSLGEEHPVTAENNLAIANAELKRAEITTLLRTKFTTASKSYEDIFGHLNRDHYKLTNLYLKKGALAFSLNNRRVPHDFDMAQFILRDTPHPTRIEALLKLSDAYLTVKQCDKAKIFCREAIEVGATQLENRLGVGEAINKCNNHLQTIANREANQP